MFNRYLAAGFAVGLASWGGAALADSISPETFSTTLAVGESVTITKTVTVNAGKPTTSLVDVFFLSDTTGSMGSSISTVRTQASSIMTSLSSYGSAQFGVGEYKDVPTSPWGGSSDYAWKLNQAVTSSTSAVQTGINQWSASGGNDGPEANIIALNTVATSDTIGWRADAAKFVVWFGDIYGHTPENTSGYPGPSVADTAAALKAAGITVIAIGSGLDGQNQASDIIDVTGGVLYSSASVSDIVAKIDAAIADTFASYSTVSLDLSGVPDGVTVTTTPAYSGSWSREADETFTFDVTFTATAAGTYNFDIGALVDGGRVATERDSIGVSTLPTVPLPATLPLLLGALGVAGYTSRRRRG